MTERDLLQRSASIHSKFKQTLILWANNNYIAKKSYISVSHNYIEEITLNALKVWSPFSQRQPDRQDIISKKYSLMIVPDLSWQMIPWLTEGVIVLHHNGVSLLSMASYSCGVAREKGLFAAVLTNVQTCCASSQKIAPVLNNFCTFFVNFVLFHLLWSGQA